LGAAATSVCVTSFQERCHPGDPDPVPVVGVRPPVDSSHAVGRHGRPRQLTTIVIVYTARILLAQLALLVQLAFLVGLLLALALLAD